VDRLSEDRRWSDRVRQVAAIVALVGASGLLVVNEWNVQRTRDALARDDALLASRVTLQQLQNTMLRAESAQLSYLLGSDPGAANAPFVRAQQQVEPLLAELRTHYRDLPQRAAAAREAEELTRRKLAEMSTTMQLMGEGRARAAQELVRSGIGEEYMKSLDALVTESMAVESIRMKQLRATLLDTLAIGRLAIAGLLLTSAIAVALYMRQSRQREQLRADQAWAALQERDRLETEVERRTRELREIARHLQAAREDERSHLARELHDELGGLLTAAKLDVARLRRPLRGLPREAMPDFEDRLAHLVQTLDAGIAIKRRIIEDLRPSVLSDLGLKVALDALCGDFAERSGLAVQAEIDEIVLDDERETALYRTLQESLTNITRYAHATHVNVRLAREGTADDGGQAQLEVRDDGVGFDAARVPLRARGLAGMRFRLESCAGTLAIASRPGAGTRVQARVPLRAAQIPDDESKAAAQPAPADGTA
jgi:signal transduction histidine kinase